VKELLRDLNKAFENKIRLGIMSALVVNEYFDFNSLKELLEVTDGNLASHLKSLEKSRYVTFKKEFWEENLIPNIRPLKQVWKLSKNTLKQLNNF